MNKEAKRYSGLVIFLLFLIVAIGLLSYQNASDYSKLKQVFNEEKKELENNLDNVIDNYENAIISKKHISYKLKEELQNLILLRDTISNLKEVNYRLIKFYRRKIVKLEEVNRTLFIRLDSLYDENFELVEENKLVKTSLDEKNKQNFYLTKKNTYLLKSKESLEKKIANAVVVETSSIEIEPMKKRSNGKYVSTSRSTRTDAFRISFKLLENTIIDAGSLPIYIQVLNQDNKIISPKGIIKLKDGNKIKYSDAFLSEYYNKVMNVTSFINVNKDSLKKGLYTVKVYVNDYYAGESKIKLK